MVVNENITMMELIDLIIMLTSEFINQEKISHSMITINIPIDRKVNVNHLNTCSFLLCLDITRWKPKKSKNSTIEPVTIKTSRVIVNIYPPKF